MQKQILEASSPQKPLTNEQPPLVTSLTNELLNIGTEETQEPAEMLDQEQQDIPKSARSAPRFSTLLPSQVCGCAQLIT